MTELSTRPADLPDDEITVRQPGESIVDHMHRRAKALGITIPVKEATASTDQTWSEDLVPTTETNRPPEQYEIDAVIDAVDMVEAYRRWCGKMDPNVGSKRKNIMISCPLPDHADKVPSADINLDEGKGGVWHCHRCSVGGDKYTIAAIRFGYDLRDYQSKENFPKLRRRMAEDLGWVPPTVPSTSSGAALTGISAGSAISSSTAVPSTAHSSGTSLPNLPDSFWRARPYLDHIRRAAHNRGRSADAVLAVVLARVITLVHPSVTIPAIVGSRASLNFYAAMVAASGGGKSTSVDIGCELVPGNASAEFVDRVQLGSGEGLVDLFLETQTDTGPDGKPRKVKRQSRTAAFVSIDEGQSLLNLAKRTSTVVMPTLRSAWSGATLGQQNANWETNRKLDAHSYRLGLVMGMQLEYSAQLIADREGGTPQRFVFLSATDASIPDVAPSWPGELKITGPAFTASHTMFDVDDVIAQEIRDHDLAKQRGLQKEDPLDGHANLGRLKVAAALAVLDGGRLNIDVADWKLAGDVMAVSRSVRSAAIALQSEKGREVEQSRTAQVIRREAATEDAARDRKLNQGAGCMARKVAKLHADGQLATLREIHRAVGKTYTDVVTAEEILDHAIEQRLIVRSGDHFVPGPNSN